MKVGDKVYVNVLVTIRHTVVARVVELDTHPNCTRVEMIDKWPDTVENFYGEDIDNDTVPVGNEFEVDNCYIGEVL